MLRLEPELVWLDGRFRRDTAVVVDPETGRIVRVATRAGEDARREGGGRVAGASSHGIDSPDDVRSVPLPGRALLPGFVNAHSHAFQRLIRGRTHTRPVDRPDADFWSWREAMYGAALSLSADEVFHVSRFCFLEMLRSGITAVGEFHYLHHQPDGSPYPDPNELAHRVIAAAVEVGIRIGLLNVCYATGGIGEPLEDRQRRFRAGSAASFLERTGALKDAVEAADGTGLATVGVAPHSVRAVPRDWLPALRSWAVEHDTAFHMHVSERPAEVTASEAAYGLRPVELLAGDGLLDERLTLIHGIHLTDDEVARVGDAGATVCACPTTERGLGDGFVRGYDLLDAGARLALGTDSHTSLDFLEEMRLIEHHERLQRLERVVITDDAADHPHHRVAPELLDMATRDGARSLRIDAGEIAAGKHADLVAVDLDHHAVAGWRDDTLAATITLSATPDIVSDVWVAGRRRLRDRRHDGQAGITDAFRAVSAVR
ncbi:MAG: formimidoylglutamate deiminase [Candidatus Longimicrobiales bacterium M2_2A_002]